jgi:beta-catenin-like protein 1
MQARSRAVQALDHAMSDNAGTEACKVFVEASGLKYLFNAFMGKVCFNCIRQFSF